MSFNPFNKNIDELEYDDLRTLIDNEVSEGWTLEYKQEIVKSKDIAKSIASFANSEGGWYIVGIKEKEDSNIAGEIMDLNLETSKKPDNTINTAIKGNIKPIPTFDIKLLKNPNEPNKGVVVVHIEKGYDVPYFTNDGRIYCRIGESSDPEILKDRYLFEKLMERKDILNTKIDTFTSNNIPMPTDRNNPLLELNIYLKHDLLLYFKDFYLKEFIEKIKKHFTEPTEIFKGIVTANLKNVEIIPTQNSYILFFKDENNHNTFVKPNIILEIYNQGHMKFKLILPQIVNKGHYEYYEIFENELENEIYDLTIIDFNNVITVFTIIITQYIKFIKQYDFEYNFYLSIELTNYNLSIPYFDSEQFILGIHDKIIPVNLKPKIFTPYDTKYKELTNKDFNFEKFLIILLQTFGISEFLIEDLIIGVFNYFKKITSNNKN